MKLVLKEKGNLMSLFPKESEPSSIIDRAQRYDMKKLMKWEQSFDEILVILNGPENQEGMRLLFELAEEGYPEARRLLSDLYLQGQGLPESFSKAVEWDRRAKYADGLLWEKRFFQSITSKLS